MYILLIAKAIFNHMHFDITDDIELLFQCPF